MRRRLVLGGVLLALACKGDLKSGPSGEPAVLLIARGDSQSAEVGTPVPVAPTVRVTTESGEPADGVEITFTVGQGGGSAAGTVVTTGPDGTASVGSWTLGTSAGINTLTARSPGLSGSPLTFSATGQPGPAARINLLITPPDSVPSGSLLIPQPTIQLQDIYGNPDGVAGEPVTASVIGTGASLAGTTEVQTDATGTARFADLRVLGAVGDYTLSFSSPPLPAASVPVHLDPGSPASVSKQAGDNQVAPVGSPVATNPAVRVRDASSNPIAGLTVTFAVTGGGGSVQGGTTTTDGQGIATSGIWTLGAAPGGNTLSATVPGLAPVTFNATGSAVTPGPPAAIVKVSGDGQTVVAGDIAPESLVVRVQDANGAGVPGIPVTWSVLTGGGSLSSLSGVTDAGGLAAVEWTYGSIAGNNTARASAAGFNATFSGSGTHGAPATLHRNSGNNQSAPVGTAVAINPTVLVRDGNGNPVPGVSVGFAISAGGGSIQFGSGLTNAQGIATGGSWVLGPSAGSNQLSATVAGLAGSPASFFATGTPTTGAPASLAKILGDNQSAVAGTVLAESLVVKLSDAGGVGVPGVAVSWNVLTGGGTVALPSVTTDLAGLAAVEWTIGTTAGSNSVRATAAGFIQTFVATGQAGAPSRIVILTQPGAGQSGVALGQQPSIHLEDANGNPVPQAGVQVSAAMGTGGGTLSGTTPVATDASGTAQFTDLAVSGLVGPRTLLFSAPGLATVVSGAFDIAAGPAAILAKFSGDNQSAVAGTPVATNPRVVVTDGSGNPVAGIPVTFSVSSGGGTIATGSDVTNGQGRASGGQWTLGPTPGANTLTAVAIGLSGSPAVFSATGTSSVGSPASIAKVDGDSQSAAVGTMTADSLVAQVLDANNNGVPGVPVTWTVLSGGGSVSTASVTSDAGGLAAVAWTLGVVAGGNAVRASAAGFNTTFTATGVPGPAAALSKHAGDNQSAQVGTAVAVDPAVRVVDGLGNPVPGVGVNFTVTGGNGTIVGPIAMTDAQGIATIGSWTLGPVAGANTLRAASAGLTGSPVQFSATGTAAPNSRVPLIDMGSGTYFGFPGGLYPNGNAVPAAHAAAGAARARNVRPRSFNGNLNPGGRFVLLSIGLSNTSMEWCTGTVSQPCDAWSFVGQAASDGSVNHQSMVILNGARPGQGADSWESPTDLNYDLVRDNVLLPQGVSERQVEIVWLKVVNGDPQVSLPSSQSDAVRLVTQYGNIVRALKVRYPNLEMVFFSSRIYAGYATIPLNPEPYAYESGFGVKWVIEAQIDQMANGGTIVDPRAGNLNRNTGVAPWIGWGPYTWADGLTPRSDGLTWSIGNYQADGTHPSVSGVTKVAGMLLSFFKTDPRSACWFLAGQTCP